MANQQTERVAFRRKWKFVKGVWWLFVLAFLPSSSSVLFPSFVIALVLSIVFLLGGGVTLSLTQGNMIQENVLWLQQYGNPLHVAVSRIEGIVNLFIRMKCIVELIAKKEARRQ